MAKIAGVLGIRVVGKASDEGTLQQLHKCRGETKAIISIWDEMKKHGYHGGKVRLAHCFNPQMARALSDTIPIIIRYFFYTLEFFNAVPNISCHYTRERI